MRETTVIDYIVQRLADEGITECFGVPGDYAFPVCDAVDRNSNVRWVGCSNGLNAAYAADGYSNVKRPNGTPDWELRFPITFLLPGFKKSPR